jgi:hypothetical protein
MRKLLLFSILTLLIFSIPTVAQVGKISGIVKDANTGETLIGANVIIDGMTIGAATNIDGYYYIINVPPGVYDLKASMVGYTPQIISNVRVNINLTTEINVELKSSSFETAEVVVVATQPIVRQDVSSSVINLNVDEIKSLPVVSISSVIGLQAGVQGLTIRGGASDQTAFVVNGITLRDERDNTPYTGISFTSIDELQIQTGGFNAEYGNIRSGLINVVTKEGKKDRYNFSFISRYSPETRKHFGDAFNSPNSYWILPYIDDAVCWTGTNNGNWDKYIQRQYDEFKGGWNAVSEQTLSDDDPTNDLTPQAAQQVFLWQHRKQMDIEIPDYDIDMNLNGPIPYSEQLGNLRFALSYRRSESAYLIPLSTNAYRDYNFQAKLTSDIADNMKLSIEGLMGTQTGTSSSRSGGPGLFQSTSGLATIFGWNPVDGGLSYLDTEIYSYDYWAPSTLKTNMVGAKFTHVLNQQTFYEVIGSRVATNYNTNPGRSRDLNTLHYFGGVGYNEAPFGVYSGSGGGIGSSMNLGLGWSNSRDSSKIATYTVKGDFVSQVDKFNYIKAGFEFILTDNNVNYALVEPSLPTNNARSVWHTYPKRFALYAQDKLEFEGMIANIGLRLDYIDPGGDWYEYDLYNKALSGEYASQIDYLLTKVSVKKQLNFSPRIGIAFPITVDSKLYFNYGHFRSMPTPENLFLLRTSQSFLNVTRIANPSNPLPKTVAYELGYEQNLFDEFLLSVKGYYKDVTDQPRNVQYVSRTGSVNYARSEAISYADIRGFEIDLRKNRGNWINGFINYTYMISSSGYFGYLFAYENPVEQRSYEYTHKNDIEQDKPVPRPYARANIDLFTPIGWGPDLGGIKLLDQWRLSLLGSWSSGRYISWTGGGSVRPGFINNMQWKDIFNVDIRLSKTFNIGYLDIELFMDVYNIFNIRYMDYLRAGFVDLKDYDFYMQSLHMDKDAIKEFSINDGDGTTYSNIPGEDTPGDFRDPGVAYQPLEYVKDLTSVTDPNSSAYYYDASSGKYFQWTSTSSSWSQVSDDRISKVLDTKAYIDMPNLSYMTFLNPRDFFFGIKFNINF